MLIINPLNQTVTARFELWRSVAPKTSGLCLTRAGVQGDQARSMLSSDYELIWIVEGVSYLEVMTKYYAYLDWGEYRSKWPDLEVIPFFYNDAIDVLKKLPKQIKPFSQIKIYADGHTEPSIPSPIPLITIQNQAVWSVNVRFMADFGGHGEPPVNEPGLIVAATELICQTKPHLLESVNSISLICPIDIAEQMLWIVEDRSR